MDDISSKLGFIRYSKIITDPFPEHTQYNRYLQPLACFDTDGEKPEDISIWKAYQMGYDKAYKEIEEGLKDGNTGL